MSIGIDTGILLVDKPVGRSSFFIVRAVRKVTGVKKVGHAGTLDPFASGLLVVCIGRPATKLISSFMDGQKEYLATLRLGAVSTTQDPEGTITETGLLQDISDTGIMDVLTRFKGNIMQVPPSYSALKHKGKPLYHYARKGISIKKAPRQVYIHLLEWIHPRGCVDGNDPVIMIKVVCSKGTYIRTLAADIGEALGCGAYLTALRRTRSGFFSVEESMVAAELWDDDAREKIASRILSVDDVRKLLQ